MRVAVVNGQEVFQEVEHVRVLVVLVEVDLNAGEELLDHHVEAEVVVPAAQVQLLFVGTRNVGVELIGEVNQNVVVFVYFTNLPKRPGVPSQIPEDHLADHWAGGLEQGHELIVSFPVFFNRYVIIHIVEDDIFSAVGAEDVLLFVEDVVFDVGFGPDAEIHGEEALDFLLEEGDSVGDGDEETELVQGNLDVVD